MEENQTQNTSAMRVFEPDQDTVGNAHVNAEQYKSLYADSVADPEAFWAKQGQRLDWIAPFTKVKNVDFTLGNVTIKWFEDGVLNVSANCIDRHLETRGDQTAIIWEPDEPSDPALHITYKELHSKTCKMANVLKSLGVTKGDRVVIYLPMIPEAAYAMLACARIGAIHSIVFAGFSPDALAARISGCDAKVIITADEAPAWRPQDASQVQCRRGALALQGQRQMPRRQTHRGSDHLDRSRLRLQRIVAGGG